MRYTWIVTLVVCAIRGITSKIDCKSPLGYVGSASTLSANSCITYQIVRGAIVGQPGDSAQLVDPDLAFVFGEIYAEDFGLCN